MPNQKGFAPVLIILGVFLLVVLGVGTKLFLGKQSQPSSDNNMEGPRCPNNSVYTVSPISPEKILNVIPLGNIGAPDHILPTDHIYLMVKNDNNIDPSKAVPVFAPADITITNITSHKTLRNGKVFSDDYYIEFSPCKDIKARFDHVSTLPLRLMNLLSQSKGQCEKNSPRPGDEFSYCRYNVKQEVKAGEELGTAGGGTSTSLDFWTQDFRLKKLGYVNPNRYFEDQFYITCPIDYFEPTLKKILSEKFGSWSGQKRTVEPLCGEVNQDIKGTAQGNWTSGDGKIDMPEHWTERLALAHDNVDPSIGIVAIGGIISKSAKIQFPFMQVGLKNRNFSQITADGNIYCYEGETTGTDEIPKGRVLIQLINEVSLKAEYQPKRCDESTNFSSPTVYNR